MTPIGNCFPMLLVTCMFFLAMNIMPYYARILGSIKKVQSYFSSQYLVKTFVQFVQHLFGVVQFPYGLVNIYT